MLSEGVHWLWRSLLHILMRYQLFRWLYGLIATVDNEPLPLQIKSEEEAFGENKKKKQLASLENAISPENWIQSRLEPFQVQMRMQWAMQAVPRSYQIKSSAAVRYYHRPVIGVPVLCPYAITMYMF